MQGGKIKNYQMIAPTTWNVGPARRNRRIAGPIEEALIGTPIKDPHDRSRSVTWPAPTTHVWFAPCTPMMRKTGEELARFRHRVTLASRGVKGASLPVGADCAGAYWCRRHGSAMI